jgi:MFS family permease
MSKSYREIFSPLLSIAILTAANGFFTSYVSVFLRNAGFVESVIGYTQSAFYGGLIIGSLTLERFILRVGHIRSFAACVSLMTASFLFMGLFFEPISWVFARFIAGYSLAGMYVVIESWLLCKSNEGSRGRILAIYLVAYYGAQSFGQLFFDWIDLSSSTPFILSALIASVSVLPLLSTRTESPDFQEHDIHSPLKIFKAAPFGFMGSVVSGIVLGAIYSFIPNFAQEYAHRVSWTTGLTIFGGMLLQWPVGKLSDLMNRRNLLVGIAFIILIPCLALYLFPESDWFVYLMTFILGGLTFTIYPLSVALVTDRLTQGALTSIAAVLLLAYGIGSALGPLLAPLFMQGIGLKGLFFFIGTNGFFLGVFGLLTYHPRKKLTISEQVDYVTVAQTTPVATELDPRLIDKKV